MIQRLEYALYRLTKKVGNEPETLLFEIELMKNWRPKGNRLILINSSGKKINKNTLRKLYSREFNKSG